MSTRSRIGVIRSESDDRVEVESIYCHFDGYPTGVGAKLRDHWTTAAKVDRLIAKGDLSTLGSVLGPKHDFDTHLDSMRERGTDWCLFYDRDRGEQDVGSRRHSVTEWPDYGQEWEYLFDPSDQSWRCRPVPFEGDSKPWEPLAVAIATEEKEQAEWLAKQG